MFLVQTPIDKQHEIYTKRGFLPFDNHLGRINPDGYKPFYERRSRSATPQPRRRQRSPALDETRRIQASRWSEAPQAGFPTYDFSVKRAAASPAHCRCKVYLWA